MKESKITCQQAHTARSALLNFIRKGNEAKPNKLQEKIDIVVKYRIQHTKEKIDDLVTLLYQVGLQLEMKENFEEEALEYKRARRNLSTYIYKITKGLAKFRLVVFQKIKVRFLEARKNREKNFKFKHNLRTTQDWQKDLKVFEEYRSFIPFQDEENITM